MIGAYHDLFVPDETETFPPEEIHCINVARVIIVNGLKKVIPAPRAYAPEELPNIDAVGLTFGGGEYKLIARRRNEGPEGQKANTVFVNRTINCGTEYGPPKLMIPEAQPKMNGASQVNGASYPAPESHANGVPAPTYVPGMPPPDAFSNPMTMMMWMSIQQREAEARAQERADRQAERSRTEMFEFIKILAAQKPSEGGGAMGAIPSIVQSVADTFKAIHAPAPAPAPAASPSVSSHLQDLKNLADVAKNLRSSDEVELVKAIGQGLGGLSALGAMGGLSGAPGGGVVGGGT